ncbi:MAG: hypothetical protein E7616_07015 [Ruminococcaceae bacterium]|nr:hypothetical protein [Oscillospiraceae bacterium]
MNFPKIKNALLCRILIYVIVLGVFAASVTAVVLMPFLSVGIKVAGVLALTGLLLFYIVRNFALLMTMDLTFAALHCHMMARRRYYMRHADQKRIERRIKHFGKAGKVHSIQPKPELFRYRMQMSMTVFHRGIEKMILTYGAGVLDEAGYRAILASAKANVQSARGSGKPLFTDKQQKKAPFATVALAVIFADGVDAHLAERLPKLVTEQTGDGFDYSFLPLVLDFSSGICYFNGMRSPNIGFGYASDNRAHDLIKKYVFGGRIPLRGNDEFLTPIKDIDPEMTLWEFWSKGKREIVDTEREEKRIFESLSDGKCLYKEECLYIKIGNRGALLAVEQSEEDGSMIVDAPVSWSYPKANSISKKDIERIRRIAEEYLTAQGYTVRFAEMD